MRNLTMKERDKLEAIEKKQKIIAERGFRCEVCGKPVSYQTASLAHRIPKAKSYLKRYGEDIIHHRMNLAVVCSLRCNSAVLLDPKTHPIESDELIKKIKEELCI